MLFRRRKLLDELQALVIASSIVIAMVILAIAIYISSAKTLDALREQSRTTVADLSSLLSYPMYFVDNEQSVRIAKTFLASGRVAGIILRSPSGEPLFSGGVSDIKSRIAPISRDLSYEGIPVGSFDLVFSDGQVSQLLRNDLAISILVIGAVLFGNFLSNRFIIGRRVQQSFRGIIEGMEKFSSGDHQARIEKTPYADLNHLIDGLNESAERIYQHNLEHQRIEQSLHREHQYMLDIIDSLPEITFVVDAEGKIVAWNRASEIITGSKRENMIGKGDMAYSIPFFGEPRPMLLDLFDTPDDEFPDHYYYISRFGQSLHAEVFLEDFLGQKNRYFRLSASLLHDHDGNQIGKIETISDITDFKEAEQNRQTLEEQLHQSQKLESIGRLAGGVAHDFNNMLAVILLQTDLALRKIKPDSFGYSRLQGIKDAAERSAQLTRQLLAFARKQDISPQVVDLNQVGGDMIKMLRRLVGEEIEILWQPGETLRSIRMDPTQIDQILANLATNARDAIEGSGQVTIRTENTTVDKDYISSHEMVPGEYVLLQVSDTGAGMSKDVKAKIFEPFFTTKGQHKGTGLGLATIYGIVKQNNGFVNVYSEIGMGTTFNIYFPVHEGEAETFKQPEHNDIPVGRGELVLVVEDEPSMADGCKNALEGLGYKVLTAGSAKEGIAIAKRCSQPIDLLLTDVVLPKENGRELSKKILIHQPDIKILFMSGYTADIISTRGILDTGLNFIQKPFSISALAIKVSQALGS